MSLCPECSDLSNRWLDYKWGEPYTRWREGFGERQQRLSRINLEARARERANLIRTQREGIRKTCEQNHQPDPKWSAPSSTCNG